MGSKTRWLRALWLTLIAACGQSTPSANDAATFDAGRDGIADAGVSMRADGAVASDAHAQDMDANVVADAGHRAGNDADVAIDAGDANVATDAGDADGAADAGDAGADATVVDTTCDGLANGSIATRVRYATASVSSAESCQFEVQVRSCQSGSWSAWSGTYTYTQCTIAGHPSCGDKPHGWVDLRIRYADATPDYPAGCSAEEQRRVCNDGVWSAWTGTAAYSHDSCTVQYPGCGSIAHGQTVSRVRYAEATVPHDTSCKAETQTRYCALGVLSSWLGTYTHESCSVEAPVDCGAVAHGASETRTRFEHATVASDPYTSCTTEEQTRSCINGNFGAWSGTFSAESCKALAGGKCYFAGQCVSDICSLDQVCSCPGVWQGPQCDTCAEHGNEDCTACSGGWKGAACDECDDHWDAAKDCNVCANHWVGSACDYCPAPFVAAGGCKACEAGWSGADCSVQKACVRYVGFGDGRGRGNGKSWRGAFYAIQSAIDAAAQAVLDDPSLDHCEVWVTGNTYNSFAFVNYTLTLRSKVHVYGGFAGDETERAQRDFVAHSTVIDGTYSVKHIVLGADDAVLDGFTIYRGYTASNAPPGDQRFGGALWNGATSPLIRNCIFDSNSAESGGAAVYNAGGHPTFEHCTFRNAFAYGAAGGAIFQRGGDLTVIDSLFEDNEAHGRGGAIYVTGGELWVSGSTFIDNRSYGDEGGGAIYGDNVTITGSTFLRNETYWQDGAWGGAVNAAMLQLHDSVFIGNKAKDGWNDQRVAQGGAVQCDSANISNSTFYANEAVFDYNDHPSYDSTRGGAVSCGFLFAENDIFWGNHAGTNPQVDATQLQATYSDIQGGAAGTGNLDVDPLFVDPEHDDVSLQAESACIGAANGGGDMGAVPYLP